MKKGIVFLAFLFCFLTSSSAYASWSVLKTGTYDLSGGNNNAGNAGYHGELVIAPQGENYKVTWRIGSKQTQVGVGVLQGDVLSVAFIDTANPSFWGVAAYKIGFWGDLEGKWTSADGVTSKPEHLIWKNHFTY